MGDVVCGRPLTCLFAHGTLQGEGDFAARTRANKLTIHGDAERGTRFLPMFIWAVDQPNLLEGCRCHAQVASCDGSWEAFAKADFLGCADFSNVVLLEGRLGIIFGPAPQRNLEKSNAFRCTCLLRPYRAFFYCSSLLAPPRLSIFHNNLVGALERARSSSRTERGSDSGGNSSQLRTVHWSLVVCSRAGHRSSKFALQNLRCKICAVVS